MLAQLVAVVAPEDHDGGVGQTKVIQLGENPAKLLVSVAEMIMTVMMVMARTRTMMKLQPEGRIVGPSFLHHLPVRESDVGFAKVRDAHLLIGQVRVLPHSPEVEPGMIRHLLRDVAVVRELTTLSRVVLEELELSKLLFDIIFIINDNSLFLITLSGKR